jgi:hypothetical protein
MFLQKLVSAYKITVSHPEDHSLTKNHHCDNLKTFVGFDIFMAVKIHIAVFWVMKLCVCFRGTFCLHLQGSVTPMLKMQAVCFSETLVHFHQNTT